MMRSTYSCWLPVSPLSPPVPSHEPGHNRGMWVPVTMSWWQAKLFPVTPQHLVRWLSLAGSLRQTARPSSYLPSLVLTLLHTEICSMTRSSVKTVGTGHQHDRVVRVFFQSPWHVIYIPYVCVFSEYIAFLSVTIMFLGLWFVGLMHTGLDFPSSLEHLFSWQKASIVKNAQFRVVKRFGVIHSINQNNNFTVRYCNISCSVNAQCLVWRLHHLLRIVWIVLQLTKIILYILFF